MPTSLVDGPEKTGDANVAKVTHAYTREKPSAKPRIS